MSAIAEKIMADDKEIAYQLRCRQSWMDRIRVAADALGMKPAAYIRMAVTQRMDQDNAPKEVRKEAKRKKD